MTGEVTRPPGVPADWLLSTCAGCDCPVWYDPAWQRATEARGIRFLASCSEPGCALRAVLRQAPGASRAMAQTCGPGWKVTAESGVPDDQP